MRWMWILALGGCSGTEAEPLYPEERSVCEAYLRCVTDVTPEASASATAMFGSDSPCWTSEEDATACATSCDALGADLGALFPYAATCSPAAWEGAPVRAGIWAQTVEFPSSCREDMKTFEYLPDPTVQLVHTVGSDTGSEVWFPSDMGNTTASSFCDYRPNAPSKLICTKYSVAVVFDILSDSHLVGTADNDATTGLSDCEGEITVDLTWVEVGPGPWSIAN